MGRDGHSRSQVVAAALRELDEGGLEAWSMRRIAGALDVQPSALYHHVASKQELLGAVADEILRRGRRERTGQDWADRVVEICTELRDAALAYRDGAEVVASAYSFGLGVRGPYDELVATLSAGGLEDGRASTGAGVLVHYVFGHTVDEQTHLQAAAAGAIAGDPRPGGDFGVGLSMVVAGIAATHRA